MENLSYMDEASIDDDLRCGICQKPFVDPVSLPSPCEQTFCSKCIQSDLENHSNNCPQCNNKSLTNEDWKPENGCIQKILGKLRVKCPLFSDENISRADFVKHIEQFCSKRLVLCSANDIKCQWNGPYDQLDEHVNTCPYEKLRTVLTERIDDSQHFQRLRNESENLENKSKQQQNQIETIKNENEILNQKIHRMEQNQALREEINQLKQFESKNKLLNQQSQEQLNKINQLQNENRILNERLHQLDQCQTENKHLND
jgi:hypothetical protein